MKFRMVKFARIPSYNQLFSGDPVWATLEVAGIGMDGRSMVTKTRLSVSCTHWRTWVLHQSQTLTVLYSSQHCQRHSRSTLLTFLSQTSSIQYENDDVMRPVWGDDYCNLLLCICYTDW